MLTRQVRSLQMPEAKIPRGQTRREGDFRRLPAAHDTDHSGQLVDAKPSSHLGYVYGQELGEDCGFKSQHSEDALAERGKAIQTKQSTGEEGRAPGKTRMLCLIGCEFAVA